jgi:hypothetical protein
MRTVGFEDRDIYCRQCKYNLRLLPAGRCPECGRDFNPAHAETFLQSLTPDYPVLDTTFGRYPLLWSGAAIIAAQGILFIAGGGAGFVGTILFGEATIQANACLACLGVVLGLLAIVRNRVSERHRFALPLVFGILAGLLAACELLVPDFAHKDFGSEFPFGVGITFSRCSFALWGVGLLCGRGLWRVIWCFAANLIVAALPMAFVVTWAKWGPGNGLATLVTALPFLVISGPVIAAVWSTPRRSSRTV